MADPVLVDLAEEVAALAASPAHMDRRRLWAGLHALRRQRTLVSYAMYTHVWEREIADQAQFRHAAGLARQIETQLRARLWKARHIPDDEPVLPTVWLSAPHPGGNERLWGIPLLYDRAEPLGAARPIPPIREPADLARLRAPRYEELAHETRRLRTEAEELLGGRLPVKFHTDELHFGPFEWVVRMRGIEALLYDVVDRPEFVHALMRFVIDGMVAYHLEREAAGAVDAEASWGFHMYWDELPADAPFNRLRDCWVYCHAQSAASLSPRMYAEFIQPYNARIAELFAKVYYHGCEDLSAKCRIIKDLPNLRLFHVGPWTPPEPVVDCFDSSVALEVHSHPTNVLFAWTPDQTRADLRARHRAASGSPHVLKLCDVETLGGNADKLPAWAAAASEVVA